MKKAKFEEKELQKIKEKLDRRICTKKKRNYPNLKKILYNTMT